MTNPSPFVVPHHVAIVMDGNGRWATRRFLPRIAGHKQGVDALMRCVEAWTKRHIEVLTVFAFSSENWNRPEQEGSVLLELLAMSLSREINNLKNNGVQLYFIGDRFQLSPKVRQSLEHGDRMTSFNQSLVLNVCFNYGGRWDIAQAARALVDRGETIAEAALDGAMALSHVADPDLLIRTGGEFRMSNFLLWLAAYTELFFSPLLWPEFGEQALDDASHAFQKRERRFGQTASQLPEKLKEPAFSVLTRTA